MEVLAIGLLALGAASSVTGQYIYYPVNGTATPPACTSCGGSANKYDKATPATYFTSFAWSQYSQAVRTATPAPTFTSTPYYAKPYSQLSQYAPNAPTTTYGNWYPNATATPTDTGVKYGQAAWTSLWNAGNPVNFTRGLYSTTVSPTPVPTAELILPDPLYFNSSDCYKFKKDFILGVAGSAGQIEGAAADEGKSPTLLDLAPFQDPVYVADENYWLYKQDLKRIADMGIKYYSFSISWARIVPFVTAGSPVNAPGLAHYDSLINYAISLGVHPVVTLLHIDTPFALFQNRSHIAPGGYYNPLKAFTNGGFELDNFYDDFTYYGKIVMAHFADRVGHWVTVNEPYYGLANPTGVANFLKSHAELYHYYHDTLKGSGKVTFKQAGPIGIPLNPKNQSHIEATNRYNDFLSSLLSNPIYLGEDFPESYKQTFPDYVALNASEKAYVNGTADVYFQDLYTPNLIIPAPNGISACARNQSDPLFPLCALPIDVTQNNWNIGYQSNAYGYNAPRLYRHALNWVWNTFKTPILTSEFGFPVFGEAEKTLDGQRYDIPRSLYYWSTMSEMLKAIWEDGVDWVGALAWSFIDNNEFGTYDEHYGLQTCNHTTQVRTYKRSFFDFVEFVESRRQTCDSDK